MTAIEQVREQLRSQMPAAQRWAYFDHAAMAPLPRPTAEAFQKWLTEAVEIGNPVWGDWVKGVERMRATAAQMIGAHPDEIALVGNTTAGISLVAEGFDWRPGDNVVTLADEFPSNVYPWMNLTSKGVETRRVPTEVSGRLDLERLAEACDERTRIVTVSWIGFATGYRQDVAGIAKIAHERGALMFLDAIQGLGAFPLDVNALGIDFMAADGHKWMLGPEGAGIAYIRREHLDRLRPLGPGWHSVVPGQDYTHIELNLRQAAARYEGGSQNNAGFLAMGASLDLLSKLGAENLAAAVLDITDRACARLNGIGATIVSDRRLNHRDGQQRSGIVAFEMPGRDPMALKRHAMQQGVVFGCRAGRLRISPHAYNNEEDLDRLVSALNSFRG
ncbi:MAG TPA: aminotransferase class V-fold PLP-dependent enzyme [Lacipirellulaceae bacterium]|nr:aminotransferase class V-fold PLP-dependent enzyme [Lacipirellulaceae bacterium]